MPPFRRHSTTVFIFLASGLSSYNLSSIRPYFSKGTLFCLLLFGIPFVKEYIMIHAVNRLKMMTLYKIVDCEIIFFSSVVIRCYKLHFYVCLIGYNKYRFVIQSPVQ